jgi:hypothetical protein
MYHLATLLWKRSALFVFSRQMSGFFEIKPFPGNGTPPQGDQMSLGKNRPRRSQTPFMPKLLHPFFRTNKGLKILDYLGNFQKLLVVNNRPIGDNSPYVVALFALKLG